MTAVGRRRRRLDLVLTAAGAAVLITTTLLAERRVYGWEVAAILLAIVVPISRMYVAAHLPLDLIGGAALGVTVGSAVNLLIGVPARPPAEGIRAGPNTDEKGDLSDHHL